MVGVAAVSAAAAAAGWAAAAAVGRAAVGEVVGLATLEPRPFARQRPHQACRELCTGAEAAPAGLLAVSVGCGVAGRLRRCRAALAGRLLRGMPTCSAAEHTLSGGKESACRPPLIVTWNIHGRQHAWLQCTVAQGSKNFIHL